jgi:hypothetical protein
LAILGMGETAEATDAFRGATDFRFGLEALTAARLVLAAELFFTLAGLVLATFFFAALLVAVFFRLIPVFWVFAVFFVFLAIVSSIALEGNVTTGLSGRLQVIFKTSPATRDTRCNEAASIGSGRKT